MNAQASGSTGWGRAASSSGERLLVLGLVPADLLTSQAQIPGDLLLLDSPGTGITDGLAQCELVFRDTTARRNVGVPGLNNIGHRGQAPPNRHILPAPIMSYSLGAMQPTMVPQMQLRWPT